jgi:hypothetical protein
MNINATIIVQAGNFLIVYWMLRHFLFRPTIAIINHEHAQRGLMLAAITQQKKSLEIQEKERQHHWYVCREYFSSHQPIIESLTISLENKMASDYFLPPLSDDHLHELVINAHKALEEKIKNVH